MQEQKIVDLWLSGTCSWTIEAVFKRVKGVVFTECGHFLLNEFPESFRKDDKVEVGHIRFDVNRISLNQILDVFFNIHIPVINTWNKKTCLSYYHRSAVFVNDGNMVQFVDKFIKENIRSKYDVEIMTKVFFSKEIEKNFKFSKSDSDYENNPGADKLFFDSNVIPKIKKMIKLNKEIIKNPEEFEEDDSFS